MGLTGNFRAGLDDAANEVKQISNTLSEHGDLAAQSAEHARDIAQPDDQAELDRADQIELLAARINSQADELRALEQRIRQLMEDL